MSCVLKVKFNSEFECQKMFDFLNKNKSFFHKFNKDILNVSTKNDLFCFQMDKKEIYLNISGFMNSCCIDVFIWLASKSDFKINNNYVLFFDDEEIYITKDESKKNEYNVLIDENGIKINKNKYSLNIFSIFSIYDNLKIRKKIKELNKLYLTS